MSTPLNILLLNWRDLDHPESGGSEKYLVEVARGLAARGHRVTFRTAEYPGARRRETVDGVHYVRRGGRYSVYSRALVAQALGRHRADVIVDVQNGVPFLTPLVRGSARVVNLVHHIHREQWPVVFGPAMSRIGWTLESTVAPAVYHNAQYVTVSAATRSELVGQGIRRERIAVIHNGTDAVPCEHVPHASHPLVTVLGRLVPQKRVEFAMESVAKLAADFPDLELQVVGSGYWEPELHLAAKDLGIVDRVTFTGHVSEHEKHHILAESWVLALPSIKEGWGLVVVEAGVHGTPSVAFSEAGGLKDSIHHGETGLLVDGGVDDFTEALRTVLSDADLRARLGRHAAEWVTRFRWPETVSAWEDLLLKVARRTETAS